MTKIIQRQQAIEFRKQGKSYGEILAEVKVSKSSLSLWLKDIPLTTEQIKHVKDIHTRAVEKYRETMKTKRTKRLQEYYLNERKKLLPFSEKELFLAGLFLYWGEGNKASRNNISINNTNPKVIKFALYWMVKSLEIPKYKIRPFLHLYEDMDIEKEINFWSSELKIPKNKFSRPYIKKSNRSEIDHKGFAHGTCGVRSSNTVIKEKILMALEAIPDFFGEKLNEI